MDDQQRPSLANSRRHVRDLRDLGGAEAPASLLPAVLVEVGLGDACFALDSPIGPIFVAYNNAGVAAVGHTADADTFAESFRRRFGRRVRPTPAPPVALARAVERRLRGERAEVRFDLRGLSAFERATLEKATEIPRGEVRPYAWIAREIGRPGAVRAVGTALGHNPVPLLIPCHRIVLSDGRIGEYVFGREAKRAALAAEGVAADELETLARAHVRYHGSTTTGIYCFPTCRNARRITAPHLVTFASDAAAQAAGYRPCKVCRPAVA
jgi:methylated-DNA-[protein]-cysteine S-methyltransferase